MCVCGLFVWGFLFVWLAFVSLVYYIKDAII